MPLYAAALGGWLPDARENSWIFVRNRKETLLPAPDGRGVHCNREWTSELYLPKIFPAVSRILFGRAFRACPVCLRDKPLQDNDRPDISFIIGHRGLERLPLLLTTLQAIAGQVGVRIECVVVEQDNEEVIRAALPGWVKYCHVPLPTKEMAYSRAWAFNVGARAAQGDFFIFHDDDLVIPSVYAREMYKYHCQGFEVVNLKRFIFYLDHESSKKVCQHERIDFSPKIQTIMQNAEAGGSVGISRKAFFEIGGFDERFVGWGGEDNEFWERALTRKVYPFGFLPIIHLWHQPQERKTQQQESISQFHRISQQPVSVRIKRLVSIKSGDPAGPVVV